MMPCPDPEILAAYAEGRSSPAQREPLEAHLAACPDCLDTVGGVSAALPVPARKPVWRYAVAAAGLLVAIAWWSRVSAPPAAPSVPGRALGIVPLGTGETFRSEAGVEERGLAAGARIALAAGSQGELTGSGAFRLDRGTLWADAGTSDAALSVLCGACVVEMAAGAECVIRAPAPAAALGGLFLGEAVAAEGGDVTVVCLAGAVLLKAPAGTCRLEAGRMALSGTPAASALTPEARRDFLAWRDGIYGVRVYEGAEALGALAPGMASAPGGIRLAGGFLLRFPSLGDGDYLIEASLRGRGEPGELGIAFPLDGAAPYYVLSTADWGTGARHLAVRRRGDRVRIYLDDVETATVPVDRARRLESRAEAPGLAAWGGAVDVLALRLGARRTGP